MVLTEALKDLGYVSVVFGDVRGVYENVVNVDEDEPVKHIPEDFVHEVLEYGRRVRKPVWHNPIFVVPSGCYEGGFPLIAFADADKVIGTSQVEFAEDAGITEFFQGCRN